MTVLLAVIIIIATIGVSSLFFIKIVGSHFRSKLEQATSAMMQAQAAEKKLQEEINQLQVKLLYINKPTIPWVTHIKFNRT